VWWTALLLMLFLPSSIWRRPPVRAPHVVVVSADPAATLAVRQPALGRALARQRLVAGAAV